MTLLLVTALALSSPLQLAATATAAIVCVKTPPVTVLGDVVVESRTVCV